MFCTADHVFGRAIWYKLLQCIFEKFEFLKLWNEGNFKISKNHEGDISQKSPEPNMWLLDNHTKSASGQLQNNCVNVAMLILIKSVIIILILRL